MDKTPFDLLREAGWPPAKLAAELGESIQTMTNWALRGVPAAKCKAIEKLSGVSVRDLRPKDWADYWPELAESARA